MLYLMLNNLRLNIDDVSCLRPRLYYNPNKAARIRATFKPYLDLFWYYLFSPNLFCSIFLAIYCIKTLMHLILILN